MATLCPPPSTDTSLHLYPEQSLIRILLRPPLPSLPSAPPPPPNPIPLPPHWCRLLLCRSTPAHPAPSATSLVQCRRHAPVSPSPALTMTPPDRPHSPPISSFSSPQSHPFLRLIHSSLCPLLSPPSPHTHTHRSPLAVKLAAGAAAALQVALPTQPPRLDVPQWLRHSLLGQATGIAGVALPLTLWARPCSPNSYRVRIRSEVQPQGLQHTALHIARVMQGIRRVVDESEGRAGGSCSTRFSGSGACNLQAHQKDTSTVVRLGHGESI